MVASLLRVALRFGEVEVGCVGMVDEGEESGGAYRGGPIHICYCLLISPATESEPGMGL